MRILTGLQPSGNLHIGNYFGSLRQMLQAQNNSDMFIFIANYHAMTSNKDGELLKETTKNIAAAYLALGIEPNSCTFWLQSDVKEVLELYWILSQFTPMGLLERAHSYKDKIAKGLNAHHGLFSYPVLMAADILLFDSNIIPVGKDQIQHVEIARDIALKVNNEWGDVFVVPEARVDEDLATVVGTDGAKMSKSYNNTIESLAPKKKLKEQISAIITDSTALEEPKEWRTCTVFKLASLFLNQAEQDMLKARYEKGGEGYGHFKAFLNELILDYFSSARARYEDLLQNPAKIQESLEIGALKARKIAQEKMQKIYSKIGL